MTFLKDLAQKIIDSFDPDHQHGISISDYELEKSPSRTEIINHLLKDREASVYLEIGVRNPDHNFNSINANQKYSVDPGVEYEENPVDFKMTSDEFFEAMSKEELLKGVLFDVIFIDGLHLADQVERDIANALRFIKDDGFVVLHDCNPLTEWHARENYSYKRTPAKGCWNGTTWKAFAKARMRDDLSSCCIDTDWGVGVVSKMKVFGPSSKIENPYWEYSVLNQNRKDVLNLISFEEFVNMLEQ